jgi:hypothetical protein
MLTCAAPSLFGAKYDGRQWEMSEAAAMPAKAALRQQTRHRRGA